MAKLTPEERSARKTALFAKLKADPEWRARFSAAVSKAQKARFAKPKGHADLAKMQTARWAAPGRKPAMTPEQATFAAKLHRAGVKNPITTARRMLPAQPEATP